MSGLCVSSVPTTSPRPVTTLMTPGGNPASWKASINTSVCIALISLGLMTTVHPAAIAGPTSIAIEPALEFHGLNMLTTPAGTSTILEANSSDQIEVFEDFPEVQENICREIVRALRTVLRCAVFH